MIFKSRVIFLIRIEILITIHLNKQPNIIHHPERAEGLICFESNMIQRKTRGNTERIVLHYYVIIVNHVAWLCM